MIDALRILLYCLMEFSMNMLLLIYYLEFIFMRDIIGSV